VARAKRTDRAEARRRNRASLADSPPDEGLDGADGAPAAAAAPAPSARARANAAGPGGSAGAPAAARPSITGAFRSSFRPLDLRGDLRALPRLLTHWSFFVPVVLSGLSVVLFQYFPKDSLVAAFNGYFSGVTPFGAVLLAGFFAPRASWLVGGLVAVAAAGFLGLSYAVKFAGLPDNVFIDVGVDKVQLLSSNEIKAIAPDVVLQALTAGAAYGSVFAAAAAWYRRFLTRANPNRPRPASLAGRRPDGKVPKKNTQRPMLARRR
jgi:hypothetical protein